MSTDLVDPEKISPEGLLVANTYLSLGGDLMKAAEELDMDPADVQSALDSREVKVFVDRVYHEAGFRNRFKLAAVMDEVIKQKLEEMDETEMGSTKDIADLIKQQHDMKMKEMEMELKLLERREKLEAAAKAAAAPTSVTNVQNNNNVVVDDSGYNKLLNNIFSSKGD